MREACNKLTITIVVITCLTICLCLFGCASITKDMQSAINENKEIVLSVGVEPSSLEKRELTWVELDQLQTFKSLRRGWDDELNILKFDNNSKNGVLFVELDGSWAGNNTLYNAFQNKVFVNDFYGVGSVRSKLAKLAIEEFSDISSENAGILASINAYFNIFATNTDGTSGLNNFISRAEAMSAIYRADTPVTLNEVPESFSNVVGENIYNEYAFNLEPYSYLQTSNGSLNSTLYNSTITRAEFIYMLVQRYFPDDYNSTNEEIAFTDCKNGGKVKEISEGHAHQAYELEYNLQNPEKGVNEDLYKALVVAYKHGIVSSETNWNEGLRGGDIITMLVSTYQAINKRDDFAVNAKTGENAGQSLYVVAKPEDNSQEQQVTEQTISLGQSHKLSDLADIDDLIKAYGDEIVMTDEEIEEAKLIGESFTIEEYDAYLVVDHCRALNVRTGPSTDYRIIKCVPKGTVAHIVGVCAENGWYRVIADGKICYQCGVYFSEQEEQK